MGVKYRFPIRIIVFDELEFIIFVSQGLTLTTASLVNTKIRELHYYIVYCELIEFSTSNVQSRNVFF